MPRTYRPFSLFVCMVVVCMVALCASLPAQTDAGQASTGQAGKTITLRMMDGKTGQLIATSYFLVRIDHQQTVHADWVVENEAGTGKLTVPADASTLSVRASYDSATILYDNCDAVKGRDLPVDRWYSIDRILTVGVVASDDCIGKKVPDRWKAIAKPGEFVFFVRKRGFREQMHDMTSY